MSDSVNIDISGYTHYLMPRYNGQLRSLEDDLPRTYFYPGAVMCMQMMFFYNPGANGLYVQGKDTTGNYCRWYLAVGPPARLQVDYYGPEDEWPYEVIEYDTSNWKVAAERYRQWAKQQAWYVKKTSSLADSLTMGCTMSYATDAKDDQKTLVESFFQNAKKPVFGWETNYRNYNLLRDGFPDFAVNTEYSSTIRSHWTSYREQNINVFPYINSLLVDFDDFPGGGIYEPYLIRDSNQNYVAYGSYNRYYACPHVAAWRTHLLSEANEHTDSEGQLVPGHYWDLSAVSYPRRCYAANHDHDPGDPYSWQSGMRSLLSDASELGLVAAEGFAEVYIDLPDFAYLQGEVWAGVDYTTVPLFNWVYGDVTRRTMYSFGDSGYPDPALTPAEFMAISKYSVETLGHMYHGMPFLNSGDVQAGEDYMHVLAGEEGQVTLLQIINSEYLTPSVPSPRTINLDVQLR